MRPNLEAAIKAQDINAGERGPGPAASLRFPSMFLLLNP